MSTLLFFQTSGLSKMANARRYSGIVGKRSPYNFFVKHFRELHRVLFPEERFILTEFSPFLAEYWRVRITKFLLFCYVLRGEVMEPEEVAECLPHQCRVPIPHSI